MSKDTVQTITETRKKLAKLEQKLHAELAKLPAKYGFKSAEEFLAAFRSATSGKPSASTKGPKSSKRKARVEITDEIRAKVKKLLDDKKSGSEIADAVGISLPSVQNIKKALGLVKKRK